MKLKQWAAVNGISYKTAWRWFHQGTLPVPAHQVASGTILVETPVILTDGVTLYARVSSADQRADLDRQVARLTTYAVAQGWRVTGVVSEVGSGMNGRRPKLRQLLADAKVQIIVVEHRDRLTRFGFEYLEAALYASGRHLRVVEDVELSGDLARDMCEVLTSFCARLYGRRSAKRKAAAALRYASEA
ncbi:MAG: IS607 family transposase [Variovorax sp.]